MVRDVAVWWVRLTRIFGTIRCHSVFLIIMTWWLTCRINSRSRSCLHTWMPTTFANAFVPSVSFTHGSVGWVETQNLHSMLIDEPARLSWVHCEDRHGNYPTWLAFCSSFFPLSKTHEELAGGYLIPRQNSIICLTHARVSSLLLSSYTTCLGRWVIAASIYENYSWGKKSWLKRVVGLPTWGQYFEP